MKLKIFLIIFLTKIILYNCKEVEIRTITDPVDQYGELTFQPDGSIGVIFPLDISNFNNSESIYYYFEFNPEDALDDNSQSFITFYAVYVDEINYNLYAGFLNSTYIKGPKRTKDLTSATTFYFETKKADDYKYLIIGAVSDSYIAYSYTFKNTEKDEGAINKKLVIIVLCVIGGLIVIGGIIALVWYMKKKKKKKGTTTIIVQGGNGQQIQYAQQGQYNQPVQYQQNVQTYSQAQYAQQGQYAQPYQQLQYAQPQNVNNVDYGYSSQGINA